MNTTMSYVERVKAYLEGCEAVSTGICSGCAQCADEQGYSVVELDSPDDEPRYGFQSSDGTTYKTHADATRAAREAFDNDCATQTVLSEGSFSWNGCDICGSKLGGTMEPWHWVDPKTNIIQHGEHACVDCVCYLANGDVPKGDES